jgi:hypothetical protein
LQLLAELDLLRNVVAMRGYELLNLRGSRGVVGSRAFGHARRPAEAMLDGPVVSVDSFLFGNGHG